MFYDLNFTSDGFKIGEFILDQLMDLAAVFQNIQTWGNWKNNNSFYLDKNCNKCRKQNQYIITCYNYTVASKKKKKT